MTIEPGPFNSGSGAGAPGRPGAVIAALMVVKMLSEPLVRAIDKLYPQTEDRYRKFATTERTILNRVTGLIRQTDSNDPHIPSGVYLASQNDPVNCPPTQLQALAIAVKYEIPKPGQEDWTRAAAYLDIVVTRKNFYDIRTRVNGQGETEYFVVSPLVPFRDPAGNFHKFLYVGAGAFGIEIEQTCY